MVICKYYRQGNCRNGQYCQFEHINNFGGGNKSAENQDEITAIMVAKEVLLAERGGQWLLSCFAPFKERPCIPGMEDLSPEEVRWEMYQAQKNGMVEQAKLHFQQLCQDMKARREALKNPRETIGMLKKLLGTTVKSGASSTAAKSSTFSFAAPQLSLSNPATTSTNVFGSKPFSTQSNPFGTGFNSTTSSSIFGRTNNTAPIFGATPAFNANVNFGTPTSSNSMFGGGSSLFGNVQQSPPSFGSIAPQSNSIFGGTQTQSTFGQPNAFTPAQTNNVFGRPQTSQPPVFGNPTSSAAPLFGTMSSQSNALMFGGNNTTNTTNLFGGMPTQTPSSIFGATTSSGSLAANTTSMFGQSKTTAAFGGAPIFGGSAFGGGGTSMFGGQSSFGTPSIQTGNMFCGPSTSTPSFVSTNQTTASGFPSNAFGITQTTPSNAQIFGNVPNTVSTSSAGPFGSVSSAATPFVNSTFGLPATCTVNTFATAVSSSGNTFGLGGATTTAISSNNTIMLPFSTSTFGTTNTSSITPTTTTVVTTSASNPFTQRTQSSSTIFGNALLSSSSPFGKPSFDTSLSVSVSDDSIYSIEGQLTDDQKCMYLAERFILGKIPLKPPTKDIR